MKNEFLQNAAFIREICRIAFCKAVEKVQNSGIIYLDILSKFKNAELEKR